MADSMWLFPQAAENIIRAHNRFFQMHKPGRALIYSELQRYRDYPVGWRTGVEIFGKYWELDVLLGKDIPFSEPRIALADGDYHLIWPHVEKEGLLCLRTSDDLIDHSAGVELTSYYIEEARQLLEDILAGKSSDDFVSEFGSYWNRWIHERGGPFGEVWLLAKAAPPSRMIYFGSFGGKIVVSDSLDEGMNLARAFFHEKNLNQDRFERGIMIWPDQPLLPDQYPKHNAHVAEIARRCNCFDLLLSLVPNPPCKLRVAFGFDTSNGPALGAIQLNEPVISGGYKKPIYLRVKGNRPSAANKPENKKRYFVVQGKSDPMKVQRIGREWIFERGGKGLDHKLDEARVCLIGCGSLGAQVSKYLVQSGLRKLVLVDPDMLSWDNIGRHLLGADAIGEYKSSGLKKYLEAHFPAMLEIDAESRKWQELLIKEDKKSLLLESDILISTIGNWDAEAALNHAFNSYAEFPPIVFGWTEPFGVAGHALSITGIGGCFLCGMNSKGSFEYALSKWPNQNNLRRVPACGDTYQPYGVIDIAPIQAMIARTAIDVLLEMNKPAEHCAWIGRLNDIEASGGTVWGGAAGYYGDLGEGYRYVKKQWQLNPICSCNH